MLGDFRQGPPSWMLLDTYLERGARVLALVDPASEPVLTGRRCTFVPGRPRPGPSSWQPRGAPSRSLSQRGRAGWPPGTRPSGPRSGVEVEAVSTSVSPAMGNYPPSTWLKDARWPVTTMADDVNSSAGKAFGLTPVPVLRLRRHGRHRALPGCGRADRRQPAPGRSGHAVVAVAPRERSLGPGQRASARHRRPSLRTPAVDKVGKVGDYACRIHHSYGGVWG